ncbi:MAG: O-antigen ligase family protein [Holosporales bacterium]|jgi:O-antigen ligase|nr:O-antigen ligase family protein [Holosporales bacterium]
MFNKNMKVVVRGFFELIFVLFLFSPQYKNALTIWIELDLTLLLSMLVLPCGCYLTVKEYRQRLRSDNRSKILKLLFLAFAGWCCYRAFGLPIKEYPYSKFLCFLIYTMPAFFISYLIIGRSQERLYRFMRLTLVFAAAINFEALRVFLTQIGTRMALNNVLDNNYLVAGQTIGIGIITLTGILLSRFVGNKNIGASYWAELMLLTCMIYMQLNLGGRGPVLSGLVALIAMIWLKSLTTSPAITKSMLKRVFVFIFAFGVFYLLIELMFKMEKQSAFVERIRYDYLQNDESILLRLKYYKSAWTMFLEHCLIGVGFGGWPYHHGLGDMECHPHNIFLEIASETGLVGLVLFFSILIVIFSRFTAEKLRSLPLMQTFLCVFLFCFANALKSGDLNDNIAFFCYMGVLAGMFERFDKKVTQN